MILRIRIIPLAIILFISFYKLACAQDVISPRIASYVIDVELNPETKKLKAVTKVTWKNSSQSPVKNLYFHLYYNAFRNSESTFLKERGVSSFLTQNINENCGWGWSNIKSMIDPQGNELDGQLSYVAPDDGNVSDRTVLQVDLINPVQPGEEQSYTLKWEAKVPQTMPRTGYNRDFYFFAQWFPKLGVYELAGQRFATKDGWNCHQYHSSGEYYSDFGNYEVNITVPKDFEVASSGQLEGQSKKGEKRTWTFKVNDVIDFTWAASPHFVKQSDTHKDTEIKFYTYPYKKHLAYRYLPTIKYCMQYLDDHLGAYPYSTLTIIDPPVHGMYTGGMEYPTLITSLSFEFFPKGIRTAETLVVHEYIHQYFMQMVATHEVEEPWMDEGITSYYEGRILDEYFGDQRSTIDVLGFKCGNKEYNRAEFFGSRNPKVASNAIKSWHYKHGGYGDIAYNKAALWLQTLEGMIGIETIDKIFRIYFNRWKFKHPGRQDFIDVVNEVVLSDHFDKFPEGMDWYFKQVLFGTNECDYSVEQISFEEGDKEWGFFEDFENCEIRKEETTPIKNRVLLYRLGEVQVPQEIEIHMEDGSTKMMYWDGMDRAHELEIVSDQKVTAVHLDPHKKIMIDKNFINNSKTVKLQQKPVNKISAFVISGLQHIVESMGLLI